MTDKNVIQVKFIDKPKGLRFNSATSRHIREMGIEYMEVDLGKFSLTLKPALKDNENPKVNKVLFSGEVAQIANTELYNTFNERGLTNKRVVGEWKGSKYVFDLVPSLLGAEYKNFTAGAVKSIPDVVDTPRIKLPLIPASEPMLVHAGAKKSGEQENANMDDLREGVDFFIEEEVVYHEPDSSN